MNPSLKLIAFLVIILFLGCKQEIDTSFLDEQPLGFTKVEEYSIFESAINSNDGNIIIAGLKEASDQLELLKLDLDGNQIWAKSYFEVNTNIMEVIQKRDGGMAIMGENSNGTPIASLDAAGNELWTSTISEESTFKAENIIQTYDDGFLVVGTLFSSLGTQITMIRFDQNGNQVWREVMERELSYEGHYLLETAQKEYFISTKESTPPTANLVLLKVNEKGKLLQEIHLEQTVASPPASLKLIETIDNSLVIINTTSEVNTTFGDQKLRFSKLDMDGNVRWSNILEMGQATIAKGIIQTNNGDLLVLGIVNYGNDKSEILLLKTDQEGNEIWKRTYKTKINYRGNEIIETDKGIVVVGFSNTNNSFDPSAIILSVDDNGNPI